LAMMLNWAHITITPDQLSPKLFIPAKKGSLQIELMATPRQYGILSYTLAPQLDDLLREVSAGHPVLVFQNLALSWYPKWHYAVVVGYDLNAGTITLHSGLEADHTISLSKFEHTWARAGYWAMLTLPPGNMPARVEESRFMRALVNLEKAGKPQSAVIFYEAALKLWSGSLAAQMGRGNSYYAMGQLEEAERSFYQATIDHPEAAPAFNNLAQIYMEQDRLEEAQRAIQQAIRLDGEAKVYKDTEAEIDKKAGRRQ